MPIDARNVCANNLSI